MNNDTTRSANEDHELDLQPASDVGKKDDTAQIWPARGRTVRSECSVPVAPPQLAPVLAPSAPADTAQEAPAPQPITGPILKNMFAGLILALLCQYVQFFYASGYYMTVAIHECGHALSALFFGHPAIPMPDIFNGGGVTPIFPRSAFLMFVVYSGWLALLAAYRRNRLTLAVLSGGLLLYTLLAYSEFHSAIFTFMGHGFEIVIAAFFLFCGWQRLVQQYRVEPIVFAAFGFFVILKNAAWSARLLFSATERAFYDQGGGPGYAMRCQDFTVVADKLGLRTETVVAFFLGWCLAGVAASFLAYRYWEYLWTFGARLCVRDPSKSR